MARSDSAPAPEGSASALLSRQAMSTAELQAQVDLQLKLYPGGETDNAERGQLRRWSVRRHLRQAWGCPAVES